MHRFRQAALAAYLMATAQYRRRLRRRMSACRQAPICVLFYHRVADHTPNDWTISNKQFRRQIHWMRRHLDVVSLEEAQRRMREGNPRTCVSITFDDGYADNCDQALPFLIEHRIPVTYFVSLDYVLTGGPFPHDAARNEPLAPNTRQQLIELADAGIEIGGHTRTHADMGQLTDSNEIEDEAIVASHELEQLIQKPVRYFAFPFGHPQHLNQLAFERLRQHNFAGVLSAYGGYNFPGDAPFYIRRIHGDPEMVRLKNWLTFDPRKTYAGRNATPKWIAPIASTEPASEATS